MAEAEQTVIKPPHFAFGKTKHCSLLLNAAQILRKMQHCHKFAANGAGAATNFAAALMRFYKK